jgi:hypothetical protein
MSGMATRAAVAPDERRVLGLDRRTILPALLVLGLALVEGVLLPSINSSTTYKHQIHKGAVVTLANGITLVPTPGWALATGALAGHTRSQVGSTAQTELVNGGVNLYVQAAPFAGTASALLTRVLAINAHLRHERERAAATTRRYAVTTRQGVAGVAKDFMGVDRQGSVVAFVFRTRAPTGTARSSPARVGIEVVASGPAAEIARRRKDVVSMIRSIRAAS